MFRLHKPRSNSFGDRFEFRFSNLQAFQVPKGWDKLFVSIVSVETGKAIAKSSKTLVHGGTCQWTDSFSESIWVSQDVATKELGECLFKIIVSMGSSRSGILGEAILNLADYVASRDSRLLQLPLEKCNYGTILQIRVQCPARTKSRESKGWKEMSFHRDDSTTNNDDLDSKSDGSDNVFNRSVRSSSANHLAATCNPDEAGNRETSFSASGSHRSSDSGESSVGRSNFSPQSSLHVGTFNVIGRQDSSGSHQSPNCGAGHADDVSRSNHSSFNSRVSSSSLHANQWQEVIAQTSLHGAVPSALRQSDSCKDLLEAAEETIDELRDEAKMWERHAMKLKLDLEILKKECSEKSKQHADLGLALSFANAERDSFKQELERLKLSVKESVAKESVKDSTKIEKISCMQKEMEDEVRLLKDSNANLSLQLKKTQESNIELVSILQELEDTVEKQTLEIANLSKQTQANESEDVLSRQALLDLETEWTHRLSMKEEKIKELEEQLSVALDTQQASTIASSGEPPDLMEEVKILRAKVEDLERDCTELTEENLELLFKLKESMSSSGQGNNSISTTSNDFLGSNAYASSETEVSFLKSQIYQLEQEVKKKDESSEGLTKPFLVQITTLEKKCADLEIECQLRKDQASEFDIKLHKCQIEAEEKMQELMELYEKQERFIDANNAELGSSEKVESWSTIEVSGILSEINQQLHLALSHLKNLQYNGESGVKTEPLDDSALPSSTDAVTQKQQADNMIKGFLELNDVLKSKLVDFKNAIGGANREIKLQAQNSAEAEKWLKDNILYEQESEIGGSCEVEELKAACSSKDDEIKDLRHSKKTLEDSIADIKREKSQLEEQLKIALRESSIASKCLEDVRHELMVLTSSVDNHSSANKMLERKSMELESFKQELEMHICELENENIELSERLSGLEAQVRYLTNEKESNRSELEDSRSQIADLKDQITKRQAEMDLQKVDLRQKLQDAQKQQFEAQEESEILKRSHSKLQGTVESLMEECNSLQKLTAGLRKQKLELHDQNTCLEVQLSEALKKGVNFCKQMEFLEEKFSSLQKDIISKEESLATKLGNIFQEHKEHEKKISLAHIILNQIELENMVEVEKLEREIAQLTAEGSLINDEGEDTALDAVCKASERQSNISLLETSLQEAHAKVKSYETELYNLRQETSNKVDGLVGLLNASKQSEEMLMSDISRLQRLMENSKSSEERYKRMASDLELKLRASDYEKQQITEETSSLKLQLQKSTVLQDEIMALRNSLNDAKFEKGKLEELLKSVSEECEELKSEKISFMEKASNMQQALHDAEDHRRIRIALEEKLLRLESDLTAKEALFAQEAETKNELNRIKRTNSQYQRKIQSLEEEKDDFMQRTQALEKELMLRKEHNEFNNVFTEVDNNPVDQKERPTGFDAVDLISKIQSLETKLAEALEENNKYKMQLQSLISEKENGHANVLQKAPEEDATINHASRISSLEAELKDLQERYLNMSLQFAEVEAQREELVMQLKSTKKEKRWFS